MINPYTNYANYYVGQRFKYSWPDGDWIIATLNSVLWTGMLFGTNEGNNKKGKDMEDDFEINDISDPEEGSFRLILHHPSDISPKLKRDHRKLCLQINDPRNIIKVLNYAETAESMDFLFKNGIDCFNLIEKGFAIDDMDIRKDY